MSPKAHSDRKTLRDRRLGVVIRTPDRRTSRVRQLGLRPRWSPFRATPSGTRGARRAAPS